MIRSRKQIVDTYAIYNQASGTSVVVSTGNGLFGLTDVNEYPIGSEYTDVSTGKKYRRVGVTGTSVDWEDSLISSDLVPVIETITALQVSSDASVSTGNSSFATVQATQAIGGHLVVAYVDNQYVYADSSNSNHFGKVLGITNRAFSMGDDMTIHSTGVLNEISWNFIPGLIYLGTDGLLTQEVPTSGIYQIIGTSISSTAILINVQQPSMMA